MFSNRQDRNSFVSRFWRSRWPDILGWLAFAALAIFLIGLFVNYWSYQANLNSLVQPPVQKNGDTTVTVYPTQNGDIGDTVSQKDDTAVTVSDGATALCGDGSYSYAEHHQGACSGHEGVKRWLK